LKFEYLEDGDGLDEISGVSKGLSVDERLGVPPKKNRLRTASDGSWPVTDKPIKKLCDKRWYDKHLSQDELRDVLRGIRAGDKQAENRLIRTHHGALMGVASSAAYRGVDFEDRLSAACEGLLKAARGYDPKANNGLWAYALPTIRNELADCVLDGRRNGGKLETVADRKARTEAAGFRPVYVGYSASEERDSSDGWQTPAPGWIAADDREWDAGAAHVQRKLSRNLAKIGRALGVPSACIGVDENPRRNGGRRYTQSAPAQLDSKTERAKVRLKNGDYRTVFRQQAPRSTTGAPLVNKAPPVGGKSIRGDSPRGIIGWMANDADRRARQRLAQVGRRQYALELAEKKSAIVPLFDVTPASTYAPSRNTAYDAELPMGWPKDKPFWPEGSKWHKPRVEEKPEKQSQFRVTKGLQNGNGSFPRAVDRAARCGVIHRNHGSNHGDTRPRYRASGQSTA